MPRIDLASVEQRLKKFKGTILFDREETVSMVAELKAARFLIGQFREYFQAIENGEYPVKRPELRTFEKVLLDKANEFKEVMSAKD